MEFEYSLEDLKAFFPEGSLEGETTETIRGLAVLKKAQAGDLSFLGNKKYKNEVPESQASVILLPKNYEGSPQAGQVYLRVENPSMALAMLCAEIEKKLVPTPEPGVHPTAFVDPQAQVDSTASVGPFCFIDRGAVVGPRCVLQSHVHVGYQVVIGSDCVLMPHVSVMDRCILKDRVRLQPGAVIGSDGYGYEPNDKGEHQKVPQIGHVVLESDVEIGANTTIDRARFDKTQIGEGTKIDNLVQIAHNVSMGKHCLIVSQVGISGSTVVEDHVVMAGQVGLAGHLHIGKGSMIGGQSGLNHDLPPKSYVRGTPAYPYRDAHRLEIFKKKLPELYKRVAELEDRLGAAQEA
tara:strand:- start:43928 stop:44977 length:1050 start_codon:yes stop_codon:yes gene_type:complete